MPSIYVVQSGDSLSRIAASRGTSVAAIMAINPQIHDANHISVGDRITIPGAAPMIVAGDLSPLPANLEAPYGQWVAIVNERSAHYELEPALVMGAIATESTGRNELGDGGHGHGLMQIDDRSHGDWLATHDWSDPQQNIDYGCSILHSNLSFFHGDLKSAVSGFNAGAGGAQNGIRDAGDSDFYTTHRDGKGYSVVVFEYCNHFRLSVGPPTWAALEVANPNIQQQRDVWQAARRQLGQDPNSWPDFRAHVMAIGGADPGPRPPNGFGGAVAAAPAAAAPGLHWADLAVANQNIEQQAEQWQAARRGLGQDAGNWPAFRTHVIAIGGPDPGPVPPVEFH